MSRPLDNHLREIIREIASHGVALETDAAIEAFAQTVQSTMAGLSVGEMAIVIDEAAEALKGHVAERAFLIAALYFADRKHDWQRVGELIPRARIHARKRLVETGVSSDLIQVELAQARLCYQQRMIAEGVEHAWSLVGEADPFLRHIGATALGLYALHTGDRIEACRWLSVSEAALNGSEAARFIERSPPLTSLYEKLCLLAPDDAAPHAYSVFLDQWRAALPDESPYRQDDEVGLDLEL